MSRNDPISIALRYTPFLATIGIFAAALVTNLSGAIGFAIGSALSTGSLAVGKLFLHMRRDQDGRENIQRLQILFLAKLPVLGVVIYLVNRLGFVADECFLVGYVLVYLGLVLGAILSRSAPANFDEVA